RSRLSAPHIRVVINRPPPSPPLFPYTTLFRSDGKTVWRGGFQISYDTFFNNLLSNIAADTPNSIATTFNAPGDPTTGNGIRGTRSEEHTSELQSLTNLVCRLLLGKNTTPAPPS